MGATEDVLAAVLVNLKATLEGLKELEATLDEQAKQLAALKRGMDALTAKRVVPFGQKLGES